ncbi:MAG: aminotransferase class V-fold PLP-dependent enzyme [Bacillota bacterium]
MDFADLIYGCEKEAPTSNGLKPYINLDNAASTPPFKGVMEQILELAGWYSSVHRGAGYKSRYCTDKYEEARWITADFVKADLEHDAVIFTKNTTDSINKVSHYLDILPGEIVVFSKIEHHSNELPWLKGRTFCVGLENDGLDLEQLEKFLRLNRGKIKLLAISGASNVTGYTPPIYTLAEMAHQAGAKILVDGAQLIPHRPVMLYPASDPRHLDFLAFSGHKMYAPFGTGVLIGPREIFSKKPPSQAGGGTIRGIGPAGIIWAEPPEAEEAGSPNIIGASAIAEAVKIITGLGWEGIIEHENSLLQYTLDKLEAIPEVTIYNRNRLGRVGVVSFNVKGVGHDEVAQYLADAKGIGVRNGCFCARGYVQSLLELRPSEMRVYQKSILENPRSISPGMVRISFGCYNKHSEIDLLVESLQELALERKKSITNNLL